MFSPLLSPKMILIISLLHSWNEKDNIVKSMPLLVHFPGCSMYQNLHCIPYSLLLIKLWRRKENMILKQRK